MMDIRGSELFQQQYSTKENIAKSSAIINGMLNNCTKALDKQKDKNIQTARLMLNVIKNISIKPIIKGKEDHNGSLEKALWFSYTNSAGTHILDIEFIGSALDTYVYKRDDGANGIAGKVIKKRYGAGDMLLLNSYIVSFMEGRTYGK